MEAVSLVRDWTLLAASPRRLPTQRKRRWPQPFRQEQLMEPLMGEAPSHPRAEPVRGHGVI